MTRLLSFTAVCALLFPLTAAAAEVSQDYVNILENRLAALEQQVTTLTNQVEQANYTARQAQERLQRLETDIDTRFRMIEDNAVAGNDGAAQAAPAQDSASQVKAAPASNPEDTEKPLGQVTTGSIKLPNDPNVAYDQSFSLIRKGDYEAAEAAMSAFLAKWPNHELSSNASYWKGETLYVRGEYKEATKAFAEGYQQYPKGAKAEDTLFKLGLSLAAINRTGDACVTFEQLQTEFPRMNASTKRRVEEERAKLECPKSGTTAPSSPTPRARTR